MRRGWCVFAIRVFAALAPALAASRAYSGNGAIMQQRLDAGRVQFSGMDINGDGIADSIRVDRIKQSLFYYVGDRRGNYRSFDPATLPEEERRFVPDVLIEKDLDNDQIDDLILCNRAYLEKYRGNEPTFLRILAASVYIGQPRGAYLILADAVRSEEARSAILERARQAAPPGP